MKNTMTYRILSLVLALTMVFALAACGTTDPTEAPTDAPTDAPTEAPTEAPTDPPAAGNALEPITVENPVTYYSLTLGESFEEQDYVYVSTNEDGTIHVDYKGEVKKVADLDAAYMHNIAAELEKTGLAALSGKDDYADGEATGSMYIELSDGTILTVGYSGNIPQEFTDGYNAMDAFFQLLLADVEVYVPQLQVMEGVDADAAAAIAEIMNGTTLELDGFMVSNIAVDEFFPMSMGMSTTDGVANGTTCSALMMTTPYIISMATAAEGTDVQTLVKDMEANINWQKFVCVSADNALVAYKDNRSLCLMASGDLFTQTMSAIEAAGWTINMVQENPGM